MTFDPREDGANCDECPLKDKRPVRPELRPGAPIIVGMEPGAQEVKLGRPFVGQSGKLLDAILKENGLRREHFQVTNARLCSAPPTWSDNDARHRLAFQACRPRLERELATASSVLMFGKHALTQVFGSKAGTGEDGIMSVRGYPLEITNGEGETKPGLATFHPAFVLRQRRWRETVSRDIAKFWRLTTGTLNWVEPRIIFDPTYEELCAALAEFEKAGTPVAIDTETDSLDPEKANLRCVGLANADLAIIVGFRSVENPLRTFRCPPEKARIAIANFLKRFRPLGGHNVNVYDRPVLARHGMPLPAYDEVIDTLALHHLTDSEAPHKLGFIGSYEFDIPKWKADDHEAWESDEELHVYCGLDCVVTARLIPILLEQLIASDQERVYWSDIRLQEFAVNAHRIGIFIDEAERKRHGDRFDAAVLRAQAVSDDIIGRRINLSSPKQVAAYLYDECGIAPPSDWEPGIGDPSTGIDALYEILTRAVPPHIEKFVDNLILYRRARMWRVRYVDACAPAADGRVHPIWNPTTVKTGRLSCSDPAMQQIPDRKHDIDTLRSMFRAAPGNCYVYADMAQIQLRQVALASGDVPWLEAFVAGKDVHRVNGQTFFGIPYDKIGKNSFQRDFSKCVTGDTRVAVPGYGLIAIADLHDERGTDKEREIAIPVIDSNGAVVTARAFYSGGDQETIRVTTKSGFCIEGTGNHRLLLASGKWRRLRDLKLDDVIVSGDMRAFVFPEMAVSVPINPWVTRQGPRSSRRVFNDTGVNVPRLAINNDMAYMLGAIQGDGAIGRAGVTIGCLPDDKITARVFAIAESFGLAPSDKIIKRGANRPLHHAAIGSIAFVHFLERLGLAQRRYLGTRANRWGGVSRPAGPAKVLRVPDVIFRSPRSVVLNYLAGLFDTDGTVNVGGLSFSSAAVVFLRDVKLLLQVFGFPSKIYCAWNAKYERYYYNLQVSRAAAVAVMDTLPIVCTRKRDTLRARSSEWHREIAPITEDVVVSLDPGRAPVFDLHVPGSKSFVANGLANHNTLTYMYLFGGQAETAMRNMQKVRNPKTGERPYAKFSLTESETMRERLLRDHPALPRWWRSLIEEWRANRFLASRILGRRRYFKDSEIDDEDLNEMAAHEIQSWEGDIMGGAGATGRTMDRIPHGLFGPGLIFHGHDALLLEVRKAEKERAEKALVEAMTTECDGLPFPAEAKTGEVWSQLE